MSFPRLTAWRGVVAVALALTLAGAPATAHHGWGSYDGNAAQTLSGTIERIEPQGAHATLWLRTEAKLWEVVLAPPSRMVNRGLDPRGLRPGATVEVHGYPRRGNSDELRAEWIRAGQQTVQLR